MSPEEWLSAARTGKILTIRFDAVMMSTIPLIDQIRPLVTASDLDWILPNLLRYDDDRAGFFPSLVAKFANVERVVIALQADWEVATNLQKTKLCWRICDNANLSEEWQEAVYGFVKDNWLLFQNEAMDFYGSENATRMSVITERYFGSDFPPHKRWMYLCNAWHLKGIFPSTVEHLCQLSKASELCFERKVAKELRHRVSSEAAVPE